MEEVLNKKIEINKSNWQTVKFGDVVFEPKESTKDILAGNIQHVVGLEHITSGDLHLRNSNTIEESTTFTKKFAVDDVLFGRRRAYLKKAAQAKFSGICSGDITVLRAKDNLLPELLPFIVHNDKFFDYSIKHSAGGLSPRVKFKDLANYEFLLPPKDQQAKLAELLWAMDEVVERECYMLSKANKIEWVFIVEEYSKKGGEWTLKELTNEKYGIVDGPFGSNLKTIHYKEEGILVMQSGYVTKGYFKITKPIFVNEEKYREQIRSSAISGDILMAKIGANYGECAIIPPGYDKTLIAGNSIRVRVNEKKCIPKYMLLFLKYLKRTGEFEKHVTTTAQPALTISALKKLKIYLPVYLEQENYIKRYDSISDTISKLESKISSSKALQKSLINQVF